ncbi:MAG: pitrilysin family protein [Bacteroidota bacterium]|nr:pitrilysin family protein [Bacteroidota bacterium]
MKNNIPPVKPVSKLTPLPVYESLLDNGLQVAGFFSDDVKVLKIDFVFEAGKAHQSKAYLAAFCNAMIREEKQTKHAAGTEALLDYYGIFLQQKLQKHWSVFSFYVPVMYLNKFLPLAYKMLFEPEFTDESLHFIREKTRQNLRKNLQRTDFVADANLDNMIWGKDHPLGYYPTEQKLEHISIDDIKTFYETHYKTNCRIIISGFFPKNIHTLLNNYFGKSQMVYNDKSNHTEKSAAKNQHLQIPMENKSQVSIRWGQMCISPHHPDYFKFKILNTIFGGYFGSRLMQNIREDKAYTYGINSSIQPSSFGSEFRISTDAGREYLKDTIRQIEKEADALRTKKTPKSEIKLVKNYMAGELLSAFDGPFKHAGIYRYLIEMNLDFDYYTRFLENIKNTTPEDMLVTAQHYLNLKDLHKVSVGSVPDIQPSME